MDRAAVTKVQAVFILFVIVFAGMGGAVYWWFMQPKAYSVVWGEVSLDEPLVGATITIYDLNGNKVFEEKDATYKTGSFIFEVGWGVGQWGGELPSGFRIVATGGMLGNESFTGTVERIVHNYSEGDYYVVNAITTLIAAYMDKHPEVGYGEAEEAVKGFLGVPSDVDIVNVIEYDTSYFDSHIFMFEAEGAGGFDAFVDDLVEELEDGKNHPFILFTGGQSPAVKAFGGKFFKKLGWGMVAGLGSWAVTTGLSWGFDAILKAFGYKSEEEKAREEMQKRLDVMNEKLTDIQGTVHRLEDGQREIKAKLEALSKQIADEFAEIKRELQEIKERQEELDRVTKEENEFTQLKGRESDIVTAITTPISDINTTQKQFVRLTKTNVTNKRSISAAKDLAEQYMNQILATDGIESKLGKLHINIMPYLGKEGLLEVWSTLATKGATQYDNMAEVYLYFENRFAYLLGIEYQGINLVIDAYHGKFGNDTTQAEMFWNDSKEMIKLQVDEFLRCVERMVCSRIDTLTPTEFNKVVGEYAPPVMLQMADEFAGDVLSGLVGEEEGKGGVLTARIVNYPHFSGKNLADKIDLRFQNIETGEVFRANFTERRDGYTIKNAWGDTYKYELLYYKFEVPLGSCKLINLESEFPSLLRQFDYAQTTTITANDTYGSRGMTAYLSTIPIEFTAKWGSQGSGNGQFSWICGVAVDGGGNVYVAESNRIQKFDSSGNFIAKWGSQGSGDGQFDQIGGLAVDGLGNVYVLDAFNYRIQKFDSNGNFIAKWGSSPLGNIEFYGSGVAADSLGNVYIAERFASRIQKFDSNGNFLATWGDYGSEDGQLKEPRALAVDSAGNVYVADTWNYRIQKLDSSGNFIAKWGSQGSGDGQFNEPLGVAVDGNRNVYVYDAFNYRIQKFDSTGKSTTKWGSKGSGDGQFNWDTYKSGGVAVDRTGNVYVADTWNYRIQKFGWQVGEKQPL